MLWKKSYSESLDRLYLLYMLGFTLHISDIITHTRTEREREGERERARSSADLLSIPNSNPDIDIYSAGFYSAQSVSSGLWSRSRRVSVSRRTDVSSREKLSTSRSRLGLGQLRLVPKTNFRPNCAGHINKTYAV